MVESIVQSHNYNVCADQRVLYSTCMYMYVNTHCIRHRAYSQDFGEGRSA